ncbi:MAG: shikimate dehydrogenase [Candidatus Schmidhempelia sp.]|nr:shikimate dehydrogenase [Candidatus Schmidhempelia sp.]
MNQIKLPTLYGILGYPLGHSLSPLLHTTAFNDHGIPAILLPWSTPPEKITVFVEAMRLFNIQGSCVTIPYKKTIIPFLDKISLNAKETGAVNLIYREGDLLCGDNTDVYGFMAPLIHHPIATELEKVLLLGAGGAARAIIVGLKRLGYTDITITNRNATTAQLLAQQFNLNAIEWEQRHALKAQLVINATPLGMKGQFESQTPYDYQGFKGRKGIAYDIVYTPYLTRFLQAAETAGWHSISGLDMFIAQAEAQFKTWTGKNLTENAKKVVIDTLMPQ